MNIFAPRRMLGRLPLCLSLLLGWHAWADSQADLDAANKLYEQGKYPAAIEAYRKMLQGGETSAAVYFNLGNTFYKTGRIGEAIGSYRLAERLAPRDPDIRGNLRFVREAAGVPETRTTAVWQGWALRLSLREWAWLVGISVWALALVGLSRQYRAGWESFLRPIFLTILLVLVVSVIGGGLAWQSQFGERLAVVKVKEAVARFGPLEDSQTAFTLRDGTEVSLVDSKDDWWQVEDGKGRRGWVKAATLLQLDDLKRS